MQTQDFQSETIRPTSESSRALSVWVKASAIIALINLILVLFNLSYLDWRDFYQQYFPSVVAVYDRVKAIEPHPQTQKYLETVDATAEMLSEFGGQDTQTKALLEELRRQSDILVEENPFLAASKTETLAQIQKKIRDRTGTISTKQAFETFWSRDYLTQKGWERELNFFRSEIRPALESNYIRQVDSFGRWRDRFWKIDLFFIAFFGIEFLAGSFFTSRRIPGIGWVDGMLRRWYDIFLLLPFWRALRIISVVVRLHRAGWVNWEPPLIQMMHEPAVRLADIMTKFIMVRVINQAQNALATGEAARLILNPQPYIAVNDINEVEAIADRLMSLTVKKVLPRVQPDLEALMNHSLKTAFQQSDFYKSLQQIPGLGNLPVELLEQLSNNLAHATVNVLNTSYADTQGREMLDRLTQDFNATLRQELQDKETLEELQSLLTDFLEELKLNYVIRADEGEAEATLAEVEHLSQVAERAEAAAESASSEKAIAQTAEEAEVGSSF